MTSAKPLPPDDQDSRPVAVPPTGGGTLLDSLLADQPDATPQPHPPTTAPAPKETVDVPTTTADTPSIAHSVSLSPPPPQPGSAGASSSGLQPDDDYGGNVDVLVRLVNQLPEGVSRQTGAQIIRQTMEALGSAMEDVLTEAQNEQTTRLEQHRANLSKIDDMKASIKRLEAENRTIQDKANELSEIIDLFVLAAPTA